MPDGKPENVFGFDGAYKDPEFATKVVQGTEKVLGIGAHAQCSKKIILFWVR